MKTIDLIGTDNWLWTKTKPIGEWDFFKKISCPDTTDTDALYAIIDNPTKEAKEKEQQDYWDELYPPEPESSGSV